MKGRKKAIVITASAVLLVILGVACIVGVRFRLLGQDIARLKSEQYDTVFFSMYDTSNYREEEWMRLRGMDIVKTEYQIPDAGMLQRYMNTADASDNVVATAYLGVDPGKITAQELVPILRQYPETVFEVIISHPRISYWTAMSEGESSELVGKYLSFVGGLFSEANVRVYFFSGEEWLICNQLNYEDAFCTNEAVSQFLMGNMDVLHPYRLTAVNAQEKIAELSRVIEKYRSGSDPYPQAKELEIVFFGDSIIGNYTDSLSVPEVVRSLTGAAVYNCGYGGKSAALEERTGMPFPAVAEALLRGDTTDLPEGETVYQGIKSFGERESKDTELMFVVNYGLNDYFRGVPVSTDDPYDVTSYSGALRSGVEKLQEAYPKAQILLMTPNFTTYYGYGLEPQSDRGGVLSEYAAAVTELARELQVDVLDNFTELPITAENWQLYQDDGCHLNERGRFLLGSRIAEQIK